MTTGIHEPGDYCPDRRDELIEYVFGEMGPGASEAFESHLASCEGCRTEASTLRATIELVERSSPSEAVAEASANGSSASFVSLEEEWALLRRRLRIPEILAPEAAADLLAAPARARIWLPAAAAAAVVAVLSFSAGYMLRTVSEEGPARRAAADPAAPAPAVPPVSGAGSGNYFDNFADFTRDTHNYLRRSRMILMEFSNLGADSDPTFFRRAAGELLSEGEQYRAVASRMNNRKLGELLDQLTGILRAIAAVDRETQLQVLGEVKATMDLTGLVATLEILDAAVERTLEGQPNV